jgi:hypothetical protein
MTINDVVETVRAGEAIAARDALSKAVQDAARQLFRKLPGDFNAEDLRFVKIKSNVGSATFLVWLDRIAPKICGGTVYLYTVEDVADAQWDGGSLDCGPRTFSVYITAKCYGCGHHVEWHERSDGPITHYGTAADVRLEHARRFGPG